MPRKRAKPFIDPDEAVDKTAYGLLRLSKGASGAFEVLLKGGQVGDAQLYSLVLKGFNS
jgi:hypothetical protein